MPFFTIPEEERAERNFSETSADDVSDDEERKSVSIPVLCKISVGLLLLLDD